MKKWKQDIIEQHEVGTENVGNILKSFIKTQNRVDTNSPIRLYDNDTLLKKNKLLLEDILV